MGPFLMADTCLSYFLFSLLDPPQVPKNRLKWLMIRTVELQDLNLTYIFELFCRKTSPLFSGRKEGRKVAQSCPTLCGPMDCSPPGSSVYGNSPGKNIRVGCHSLLQGIFPTLESNLGLLHCRQILYHPSYQGSLANL